MNHLFLFVLVAVVAIDDFPFGSLAGVVPHEWSPPRSSHGRCLLSSPRLFKIWIIKWPKKQIKICHYEGEVVCSTHCVVVIVGNGFMARGLSRPGPAQHIFNSLVIISFFLFDVVLASLSCYAFDWLTACRPFIRLTSFHISLELAMNFIFIIHFHAQMYVRRAFASLLFIIFCVFGIVDWVMLLFSSSRKQRVGPHATASRHRSNDDKIFSLFLLCSANDVRELSFL